MDVAELTEKQRRFVEEYLVDLNATQAAIRAGYSEDSAKEIGYENLTKPHIAEAVQTGRLRQRERSEATADRVIAELARIAFADAREVAMWGPDGVTLLQSADLDDDTAACIRRVSETRHGVRCELHDKTRALELLGRHFGQFVDRINFQDREPLPSLNVYLHDEPAA